MAGMFYSLQETAQKLKKSEDEVKQFIKDGKLRVFYDGPNPLFKIEEVEALSKSSDSELEPLNLSEETAGGSEKAAAPKEKPERKAEKKPGDSIFLADETSSKADVLSSDTAILGEGSGLEGTSAERIDDLLAETTAGAGEEKVAAGEDDLNLDTFGSGGLLDVSLQADDTSLGGILEEIYTSEGGEGQGPAGENLDIQGEELLSETRQPVVEPAAAILPTYAEPAPDTMSNAFGIILFIPFFATILTLIIASVGFNNIFPAFFNKLKSGLYGIPLIWYLIGGAFLAALLILAGGAVLGGEKTKTKKVKTPKPKKEKEPKEKKPKAKKK